MVYNAYSQPGPRAQSGSKHHARAKLIVAIAFLLTTLTAVALVIALVFGGDSWFKVGADIDAKASIKVDMQLPEALEQNQALEAELTVSNEGTEAAQVRVEAVITPSALSNDLANSLSLISSENINKIFGEGFESGSAVVWDVGDIARGESKSIPITFLTNSDVGTVVNAKAIAYTVTSSFTRCGLLKLGRCEGAETEDIAAEVGSTGVVIATAGSELIELGKGYNLLTMPLTLTDESLNEFWSQFTTPIAYAYNLTSGQWDNITLQENYSRIKAGAGFWLYHPDGGKIKVPTGRPIAYNTAYNMDLNIGWNIVGNPYNKRIKLDGEAILVKQEGQETTTLNEALTSGTISQIVGLDGASDSANPQAAVYIDFVPGRYISSYTGFMINTTANVTLVFPGKSIFAPGELLTQSEKAQIIKWISANNLDVCGNIATTSNNQSPLYDASTGQILDQYDCILLNHPETPWLDQDLATE